MMNKPDMSHKNRNLLVLPSGQDLSHCLCASRVIEQNRLTDTVRRAVSKQSRKSVPFIII